MQKYFQKNLRGRRVKKQRGVALLITFFAITVLSFIAVELSYDVSIEYIISNKEYHRLKAYYAAKAGVEISRFRIYLYKQALSQFKGHLGGKQHLVDMIWNFPLIWPVVLPEGLGRIETEQIQEATQESFMSDVQYTTQISSEGSKIDINDLASPSEVLRDLTKFQLTEIFAHSIRENDDFGSQLSDNNVDYQMIINNMKDWIDEDQNGEGGGDEGHAYVDMISDNNLETRLPPNRPFRTLQEVKMVGGMTPEIYNFLQPHITVYGNKGINPNYANDSVLRALHPGITEEVIGQIHERRNDPSQGFFQNANDFYAFLESFGLDTQELRDSKIPFYFDAEQNFIIKSTGVSGGVQKDIIAIVYDVDAVASNLKKSIATNQPATPSQPTTPGASGTTTTTTTTLAGANVATTNAPSGPPTIVYWYEP